MVNEDNIRANLSLSRVRVTLKGRAAEVYDSTAHGIGDGIKATAEASP
jgi:hypothetical protein